MALKRFCDQWSPAKLPDLEGFDSRPKSKKVVFAYDGGLICERSAAKALYEAWLDASESVGVGQCLVTGQVGPLADVHPVIKGIANTLTVGARLVSSNIESCESYGQGRAQAAPVNKRVAAEYGVALNLLSKQRQVRIGGLSVLFGSLSSAHTLAPLAEQHVGNVLASDRDISGSLEWMESANAQPIFIAGLKGNSGRIAQSYLYTMSTHDLARRVRALHGRMADIHPCCSSVKALLDALSGADRVIDQTFKAIVSGSGAIPRQVAHTASAKIRENGPTPVLAAWCGATGFT